jgi:tRNA nucleotidyltransferase (CCA-adding enzyme)
MKKVLEQIKKEIIPSKEEQKKVNEIAQEIVQLINQKADKFNAELIIGGSVAKGTWLPGIYDIDCFLRFDYEKYKNKSEQLPEFAEKIVRSCFKEYKRLHGSRDYFQTNYLGYDIEIIPVLKITKPKMMKNITDVSPLHFIWLSNKTKKQRLENEIRTAKKFFRANELYGAESFIRGFSGHVIEVLTVYYGDFVKLLKGISKWKDNEVIDSEQKYIDEIQLMLLMNDSKLTSPLIVVDPIQPERNAAAVVSKEKFKLAKKVVKQFLKKPNTTFFIEKKITIKQINARKTKNRLILLSIKPNKETTIDIPGCKILKQFDYITRLLIDFDFKIIKQNWYWDKHNEALIWFYINPKKLSATFRHAGPPAELEEHANAFRKQWKKFDVKTSKGKLYVDFSRKIRTVDDFLKELKKDTNINIKIL